MEYIKIEDGKVTGHYSAKSIPDGKEYKEVINFTGYIGCDSAMLNEDGSIKTDSELVELGFIKDNRGDYYNTKYKSKITIEELGVSIPDGYTDKIPNSEFDDWDGTKWVENADKKKAHEDSVAICEAKEYLTSTDYKVIKAFESGVTLDELYPGESEAREAKRQIIRDLTK